jgi:large subunit ribosomal protein L23
MKSLALKPRVSEKAYALSESGNTYTFDIENGVNKHDVLKAVKDQYDVTVTGVRIVTLPGKKVRTYRARGRKSLSGRRSDTRKAYVTLKEGDKLPIFAAVEESAAPKEKK